MRSSPGRALRVATPVLAGFLMLATASSLFSTGGYFSTFTGRYAGSATANASCQVCHGSSTSTLNRYGRAFQLQLSSVSSTTALANIESQNSDVDAGGFSNLAEITAGAQPGWTAGANTVYTLSGTASTETAPSWAVPLDPAASTAPEFNLTSLALEFGATTVGTTLTRTTTIQNLGNANLTVSGITVSGNSDFSIDSTTPARPINVAPGGSANVVIRFTPAAAEEDSGQLSIASNDANEATVVVSLHGTGTAPAPVCDINVTTLSLNFGSVQTGQKATLAASIGNTGTGPCSVSALTASPAEFALNASVPARPFTVPANGSVSVQIDYSPTNLGADSGTLQVTSNDPDEGLVTASLAGSGTAPPVCNLVTPAGVAFGSVTVGTTASMSGLIQNTGTAACNVGGLTVSGAGFSLGPASPALPAQIAVGATLSVPLRYSPTAAGAGTGALAVASNDPDTPLASIALTGSGQPPAACDLSVDVSSVNFGSVPQGTTIARTVIATNRGTTNCSVNALSVTGTDMAVGAGSPALPATVVPGGSLAVQVTYAPSNAGLDSGTLAIGSTDPNEPVISVSLSGTGAVAAVCNIQVSPLSLADGAVPLGSNASRSTTITNTGTANCTVNSLAISGTPELALGGAAPALPHTLIPGGAVSIPVVYTPTNVGDDAGALAIGSSDPDQPGISVSLSGSGVQTSQQCDVQVSPLSLNFGNLAQGSNAVLSTTVKNAGTAPCNVTRQLGAGSSDFALTQAEPLVIAAGQSATLSVRYTPSNVGSDSGSVQIGSNDPAQAVVPVALAGTGFVASGKVDLAIVDFNVRRSVKLGDDDGRARPIAIQLVVENRGTVDQARPATLTGMQNGAQVYSRSLSVSAPIGRRRTFQFPSYAPGATGTIRWTLVIADDVPADSQATATTQVERSDDDDHDDDHDDDRKEDRNDR